MPTQFGRTIHQESQPTIGFDSFGYSVLGTVIWLAGSVKKENLRVKKSQF
jgi:hypothetical protein